MRHIHRLIISSCLLAANSAQAAQVFVDGLVWRVTQPIDWIQSNTASLPTQNVTYKVIDFNSRGGVRFGFSFGDNFTSKVYFTHYTTRGIDYATGNLTGIFLGAKIANSSGFYNSASIDYDIDYNIADWQVGKDYVISNTLTLHPIAGLEAGSIKQNIKTYLEGSTISAVEKLKNDFTGIGPKAGIIGTYQLYNQNKFNVSLLAEFFAAFLAGHWVVDDVLTHRAPLLDDIDINVDSRNFGSLTIQTMIGANVNYKNVTASIGYEITDWFNQNQLFDDATGPHNNDLLLQGLTIKVAVNLN